MLGLRLLRLRRWRTSSLYSLWLCSCATRSSFGGTRLMWLLEQWLLVVKNCSLYVVVQMSGVELEFDVWLCAES